MFIELADHLAERFYPALGIEERALDRLRICSAAFA